MIRCLIIDDEKPAVKVLQRYIKRLPNLVLVGAETNPMQGIAVVMREKPDLVFLDIQMQELNGLDVMKIIGGTTKVVFCTAWSEFAVTSYELEAVDYLVKPIEFDRFLKAVQKVNNLLQIERSQTETDDYLYMKRGRRGQFTKIYLHEIDYVQARSNYVDIHFNGKHLLTYQSLKEMCERLPSGKFIRIHKSYIVALDKIAEIDNNILILKNNVKLHVSAHYKDDFQSVMRGRIMGGMN